MTPTAIKKRLFKLGHFNNPDMPTGITSEAELKKLSLTDEPVRIAIKSYQEFFAPQLDRFSIQHHGRIAHIDGEVGPATEDLLNIKRCEFPDFPTGDPDFTPIEVNTAAARIEGAKTGSGSWPVGCHKDWPNNHAFVVSFNKSGMPSFLGSPDDPNSLFERAWKLCAAAYAHIGIVFVREDGNSNAHTQASFTRGAGWIGLAIVPNNPRCNDRIWAKFDNRYNPGNALDQWARLLAHEFGHNMGSGHSRGGIMNPSIISGPFTKEEWREDVIYPTFQRWFGGEPVNVTPDEPPTPDEPDEPEPPTPDEPIPPRAGLRIEGVAKVMDGTKELGRFVFVPQPRM